MDLGSIKDIIEGPSGEFLVEVVGRLVGTLVVVGSAGSLFMGPAPVV